MEPIVLDFTGMKGKKVFETLRDTIRTRCKDQVNVEVLVDDDECVGKVRSFSKMTGCQVTYTPRGTGYTIRISGSACKCI